MRITRIDCHVLLDRIARAIVQAPGTHTMDRGFAALLLGADPRDPSLWQRLYVATAMTGRRGAGVHVLGAVDMALRALAVSALRRELVRDELALVEGRLALPERPGLVVELDREALERFAEAANRLERDRSRRVDGRA